MKLFLKIFIAVFIMFAVIVSAISYLTVSRELSLAENHIVEENVILASFLAKETQIGYLENKWPFESLKGLSEREDFIFWWIVKEDGIIHLADNASFMGTHTRDYFPQVAEIEENTSVFLNKGQNYGVVVAPFEAGERRWSLWLGFSMKHLWEIQSEVIFSTSMVSVLAMLALGIFLYFNIVHFTRPMQEMLKGTESVAKGNLDYRLSIKSKDEVGELASAFNKMTIDLKESREKLEEYSKGLEKEVADRTKELEKSKKELESKVDELERFSKLSVGRELKMVELKKRIRELEGKLKNQRDKTEGRK